MMSEWLACGAVWVFLAAALVVLWIKAHRG